MKIADRSNRFCRVGHFAEALDLGHRAESRQTDTTHARISAFNSGWSNPDIYKQQVKGTHAIINGVMKAGMKRLLFVGGAGSLEVKPGVQSVDLPEFPAGYKQEALATREALNLFRKEPSLEGGHARDLH